jgi:hypothetical protein
MRRILLEEGTGVVEALKAIRGPLFGLFLAAIDTGDSKAAAVLAARLHESLALAAKLTGELAPHAGVSGRARAQNLRLPRVGQEPEPILDEGNRVERMCEIERQIRHASVAPR